MNDYDGYNPIHYCSCGCKLVIGDGNYASGKRHHSQLMPPRMRYGAGGRARR